MKLIIEKNEDSVAQVAADIIKKEILNNKKMNICFATGNSPLKTYNNLIKMYENKEISFKNITSFNLDEYVGISKENPCSYHYFMHQNLFNKIDINPKNINLPNGNGDIKKNGQEYEKLIVQKGGIDLMILGIGVNGHIAFNEPGSKLESRTREIELTESTIEANKIYFKNKDEVPKTAISMGLATILEAKKIILIATGQSKSQAIFNTIHGEITEKNPASFLNKHNDVTLIIDEKAAKLLKN
ncbi:glucosamine-6-phosphate deaminase [Mesomycoplasma lagogenitalium]|uniref:Glucosamine-6-phosphate deaminase n=1 Tax=Mesomycoplasma lagogenitalium TaxID=171286 RepID=A0ABY8LU03_9BACT|nr:glucosamine-6-phosphate deaminase [Mesomycoplasma lagogenitalium]WGI36709.1 glucosamine-6-phosphate deaminase [Mesomycoplasma lagogenitalium]